MSNSSSTGVTVDIDMATSVSTDSFHISSYSIVAIQFIWSSVTGTINGTLQVQGSNNNKDWANIGSATSVSGASGTALFEIPRTAVKNLRVVYTKIGITGGALTIDQFASN